MEFPVRRLRKTHFEDPDAEYGRTNKVLARFNDVALPVPWLRLSRLSLWWSALLDWLVLNRMALVQVLAIVVTLRLSLGLVGYLAEAFLPQNAIPIAIHFAGNDWIEMWMRWDAVHYLHLAENGYAPGSENIAFFPLYPMFTRVVAYLTRDWLIAGLGLSTVAFAIALFYLKKLVELDFDQETASRTLQYVALAPVSFFFFSFYTESLFLALTVATIYHARKSQWVAAGILGGLACLTRPNGILIAVPLAYLAFIEIRKNLSQGSYAIANLCALPMALLGWMVIQLRMEGDPLAFIHVQAGSDWQRHFSLPWDTLASAIKALLETSPHSFDSAQYAVDLVVTLLLIIAAVLGFRYLPRVYALYLSASVVFLLLTRTDHEVLFSMPRFALVLFPAFMLLGMAGRYRWLHQFILVLSILLLGLYTALFVNWYWIA